MSVSAASKPALGENSLIRIAGARLRVITGTVDEDPEKIDATDNASGGFRENSRGPRGLTITFEAYWRAADNPLSNAPSIYAGEEFTGPFQVFPDFVWQSTYYYDLPVYFVEKLTTSIEGVGLTKYSGTITNQGIFYRRP